MAKKVFNVEPDSDMKDCGLHESKIVKNEHLNIIKYFFGGAKKFDSKFTLESFSLVSYLFNSICTF
jgi:hypothetical protein